MSRKIDKHTSYFEVLETLRKQWGCVLCALERKTVRRYVETLLYERANDPGVRNHLRRSRGFCNRHAALVLSFSHSLSSAILYRDQIHFACDDIEKLAGNGSLFGRKPWTSERTSRVCPACAAQFESRKRWAGILAVGLSETEMRDVFQDSTGLCLPHFHTVLDQLKDPDARAFFIESERRSLDNLLGELDEFIRKQDYRFADEKIGAEGDSWMRAIRMIAGGEGIF